MIPLLSSTVMLDPLWPAVGFWIISIGLAGQTYGFKLTLSTLGLVPLLPTLALGRWLGLLLLYAGLMVLLGMFFSWLIPHWASTTAQLKSAALKPHLVYRAIWISPWLEEIMFRGILLGSLIANTSYPPTTPTWHRVHAAWRPILLVCILFTLCHSQYNQSAWAMAYVCGQSLILSISRVHTGTLWMPIILHTLNNAISLL